MCIHLGFVYTQFPRCVYTRSAHTFTCTFEFVYTQVRRCTQKSEVYTNVKLYTKKGLNTRKRGHVHEKMAMYTGLRPCTPLLCASRLPTG